MPRRTKFSVKRRKILEQKHIESYINFLPSEILVHIGGYLDTESLANLIETSQKFTELGNDEYLWRVHLKGKMPTANGFIDWIGNISAPLMSLKTFAELTRRVTFISQHITEEEYKCFIRHRNPMLTCMFSFGEEAVTPFWQSPRDSFNYSFAQHIWNLPVKTVYKHCRERGVSRLTWQDCNMLHMSITNNSQSPEFYQHALERFVKCADEIDSLYGRCKSQTTMRQFARLLERHRRRGSAMFEAMTQTLKKGTIGLIEEESDNSSERRPKTIDTIMEHVKSTHPYLTENEKEVNDGGLSGLVNYANKCTVIYLQVMQRYLQHSWDKNTQNSEHTDVSVPRALYTSLLWELQAADQSASIWDSTGPRLVDQWMDRLYDGWTPEMLIRELTVRRYIRSNTNDGHLLFGELMDTVDSCINYIYHGTHLVLRDIRNFITRRLAVFREFQQLQVEKVHRIQRQFLDLIIPSACVPLSNVTVTDELPSFRASTLTAQYERMDEMFSTYMRNGRLKSLQNLRNLMERIFK